MKMQLGRTVYFNCAHSYKVKSWSFDQNLKEFGPCFSQTGHGHSYRLECVVEGEIDQTTGMMINLRDLDSLLKSVVLELDGKFLDKEIDAFKNLVPTTERIAEHLFKQVDEAVQTQNLNLKKLTLYETDDLWVECTP